MRLPVLLALALFAALPLGRARACATCQVGDPTLTVMGAEQPYRHRTRASATYLFRTDSLGAHGGGTLDIVEHRVTAALAYAPTERLVLSASLPLVDRTLTYPSLREERYFGVGDLDLRARVMVYRDRAFAPRHMLGVVLGLELPTARARRDANGALLPLELQPGSGSVDPLVGLSYAWFGPPWSAYVVASLLVPTPGYDQTRGGPSTQVSGRIQAQPHTKVGVRAGLDARFDAANREAGAREPNSGGAIVFGALGVVVSVIDDLLLTASVSVPMIQALRGDHREGVVATGSLTYDF